MAKVADVKLTWKKSVSADVSKVEVVTTINGQVTTTELGPEVESFMIEVAALGVVSFHIVTYDTEGNQSTSVTYGFSLGDLEAPQPATDLSHEIVGIRDVTPPEPVEPSESRRR